MEALAAIIMGIGGIITLVGAIWFLVVAFQESIVWGLLCLFIGFVSIIFLILHWREAKKPFLVELAGIGIFIVGNVLAGGFH